MALRRRSASSASRASACGLGADLGELRALAFDLGADGGKPRFQIGRRRQLQ